MTIDIFINQLINEYMLLPKFIGYRLFNKLNNNNNNDIINLSFDRFITFYNQ